jgi:hypothetical protein
MAELEGTGESEREMNHLQELKRLRKKEKERRITMSQRPQGLKPRSKCGIFGTTKVVP